ncbi:MAG: helix-turn-helix domain-containing protein [Firmicutes bacterium]|nr:helix-turn-helix domain-containing protein [Bacillota bacterium]
MDIFQKRLKEERAGQGITQREMAGKLQIPLRTYINYEQSGKGNRQPDLDTLVKIAKILGVRSDYLLGMED